MNPAEFDFGSLMEKQRIQDAKIQRLIQESGISGDIRKVGMNFSNFLPPKAEAPPAPENNDAMRNPRKFVELPQRDGIQKDGPPKRAEPALHKQPNPTTKVKELPQGQMQKHEAVSGKTPDPKI